MRPLLCRNGCHQARDEQRQVTAIAIGYMCALAYCSALVVYQLGGLITGEVHFGLFTVVAVVVLAAFIYLMVRPNKYADNNEVKLDTSRI